NLQVTVSDENDVDYWGMSSTLFGAIYSFNPTVFIPDGQTNTILYVDAQEHPLSSGQNIVISLLGGDYTIGTPSSQTITLSTNPSPSVITLSNNVFQVNIP